MPFLVDAEWVGEDFLVITAPCQRKRCLISQGTDALTERGEGQVLAAEVLTAYAGGRLVAVVP